MKLRKYITLLLSIAILFQLSSIMKAKAYLEVLEVLEQNVQTLDDKTQILIRDKNELKLSIEELEAKIKEFDDDTEETLEVFETNITLLKLKIVETELEQEITRVKIETLQIKMDVSEMYLELQENNLHKFKSRLLQADAQLNKVIIDLKFDELIQRPEATMV